MRKKKKKILQLMTGCSFIVLASIFFLFQYGKSEAKPSVELTLNSFSPKGSGGGVMIPASCESGWLTDNNNCLQTQCATGICADAETCAFASNGSCGFANGQTLSTAPNSALCNAGSASAVTGSGPWNWTCSGLFGGAPASCSANKSCTPSCPTSCGGGGESNGCSGTCAARAACPVNGVCGTANGGTFATAPNIQSPDLCTVASGASAVSGAGPWNWTCAGTSGGVTANCAAAKTATPINGNCSAVSGGTYTSTVFNPMKVYGDPDGNGTINNLDSQIILNAATFLPSSCTLQSCDLNSDGTIRVIDALLDLQMGSGIAPSRLCNNGIQTNLSGSGPWDWSCVGTSGGSTAVCNAFSCTPSCPNPNTVCLGSSLGNDGCGNACLGSGTKVDGVCCVSNGVCTAAGTCIGNTCINNCGTVIVGTKTCSIPKSINGWREVAP